MPHSYEIGRLDGRHPFLDVDCISKFAEFDRPHLFLVNQSNQALRFEVTVLRAKRGFDRNSKLEGTVEPGEGSARSLELLTGLHFARVALVGPLDVISGPKLLCYCGDSNSLIEEFKKEEETTESLCTVTKKESGLKWYQVRSVSAPAAATAAAAAAAIAVPATVLLLQHFFTSSHLPMLA